MTQTNDIEFRASWRSGLGTSMIFAMCMTAFMMLLALSTNMVGVHRGLFGTLPILAWIYWLIGRQFFSKVPVLVVGPNGISGYFLRNHTVPWSEVVDVSRANVQGTSQLVIEMAPGSPSLLRTASWLSSKKPERTIVLNALRLEEQKRAVEVVLQAFATYGGDRARAAADIRLADFAAAAAFESRLHAMTPTTWALFAVVALNVGVWMANVASGMSILSPAPSELFRSGANSASAVILDHQYWRLLTATFVHAGVIHLALNMIGLWAAGRLLSRLYGNLQFLEIYLASALAGSALSLHFSAQTFVSVGASGAVFGVLGALLVAVRKHRQTLPKSMIKSVFTSQGFFLVYALVHGFTQTRTDNAAHVGGLVTGAMMAWLLVERIDERSTKSRRGRQALACATASAFFVLLITHTEPPQLNHRQLFEVQSVMTTLQPKLVAAEKALYADAKSNEANRMTDEQMYDAMKRQHIPAYREINQALRSVKPDATYLLDLQQLTGLLIEGMELEIKKGEAGVDRTALDLQISSLNARLKPVADRFKAQGQTKPPA